VLRGHIEATPCIASSVERETFHSTEAVSRLARLSDRRETPYMILTSTERAPTRCTTFWVCQLTGASHRQSCYSGNLYGGKTHDDRRRGNRRSHEVRVVPGTVVRVLGV
jgi:hypothetical protein